jgi:hypothetical protein
VEVSEMKSFTSNTPACSEVNIHSTDKVFYFIDSKNIKDKWIIFKDYKVFDNGLWEIKEKDNPLSELVEVSKLKYLGLESGIHIYLCEEPPIRISQWVSKNIEDKHVYIGVDHNDESQTALLWQY